MTPFQRRLSLAVSGFLAVIGGVVGGWPVLVGFVAGFGIGYAVSEGWF